MEGGYILRLDSKLDGAAHPLAIFQLLSFSTLISKAAFALPCTPKYIVKVALYCLIGRV